MGCGLPWKPRKRRRIRKSAVGWQQWAQMHPLQHSNPASLYLASLQGSEASRTTARSVMKQIAVLCDQTPDTFPWHRLDRATVLALMEKLKQKGLSDNTRNLYLSIIKGVSRVKPCCISK